MTLDSQSAVELITHHLNVSPQGTVYLALSGGVDSVVLLHLLVMARQAQDFKLHALHADHGLQECSRDWVRVCESMCLEMDVDFSTTRLKLMDASEASARSGRYDWMRSFVRYGDILLTAHHQQDRAETVLFNLLRGSGSAGLSSLRAERPFYGARLIRPLINTEKHVILDYAHRNDLNWIEDPSNRNERYARNHIRQTIIPTLNAFRSDAVSKIARAASNLEQENCLLSEIAISDLAEVREQPRHLLDNSNAICVEDMQGLSSARQINLLRFWLGSLRLHLPSKRLMEALVAGITEPPAVTAIFQEEGAQFRFYKGFLFVMPARIPQNSFLPVAWRDIDQPLSLYEKRITLGATHKLRQFYQASKQGELRLVSRENVQNPKAPQGHSLNLKKWLQETGVPPWRRSRLPILTLRQSQRDLVLAAVDQQVNSDWIHYQGEQVA